MSLHRTRVGSRVGSATRADARRPDYAKVLVRDPTGGVLAQAARRVPQPYSTRPSVMVARACFARISAFMIATAFFMRGEPERARGLGVGEARAGE